MNDEYHKSGSRKAISRWKPGGIRYDASTKMHDGRWLKGTRGWRYVEDTCSEVAWVLRRKEAPGWYRGARVSTAA